MSTTASKPCQESANAAARPGLPPVYHHLYTLLHTIRSFASQQDEICTLLAHIQRTGKLNASIRRELTELLHELPAAGLEAEVEAVFAAIER